MTSASEITDHQHETISDQVRAFRPHLLGRWPTALGLLALVANVTGGADSHVTAMIIVIASLCYLATCVVGSRRSGWVIVALAGVAVLVTGLTGLDTTATLLVAGAGVAGLGFVRGSRIDRRELVVQTLAFLAFSALALTAMMVDPVAALYLAALAAIVHAVWDVVHVVRDAVVPRTLAEACFVLDLGLGIALILVAASW